jgi:hypothetical protein
MSPSNRTTVFLILTLCLFDNALRGERVEDLSHAHWTLLFQCLYGAVLITSMSAFVRASSILELVGLDG